MRVRRRDLVQKFYADRGPHLAAMVAYFALLSFVPLTFLALSLLGLVHRADASDFLIKELTRAFPSSSLKSILSLVHQVQDNAATLGIVGSVAAYVLSIAVSLLGVFVFVLAIYRVLTNAPVTVRDVLPGGLMAAILLEASFQIVPVFVRFAGVNPVLRVLGGPVILLLWLYL